jgi:hypothetical protein
VSEFKCPSTLAIGLFGLSWLLFESTFLCFDPKISKANTDDNFLPPVASFLNRSGARAAADDGDTY